MSGRYPLVSMMSRGTSCLNDDNEPPLRIRILSRLLSLMSQSTIRWEFRHVYGPRFTDLLMLRSTCEKYKGWIGENYSRAKFIGQNVTRVAMRMYGVFRNPIELWICSHRQLVAISQLILKRNSKLPVARKCHFPRSENMQRPVLI